MKESTREKIYNFIDKQERKILIFVGITTFIYFFAVLCYPRETTKYILNRHSTGSLILYSFMHSSLFYFSQQRVKPKVFSDFVMKEGKPEGQYKISLSEFKEYINDIKGLNTNKMTITFKDPLNNEYDGRGIYYLNGTDVTADFDYFDDDKK